MVTDVQAERPPMLLRQVIHTSPVNIHQLVRVSPVGDVQVEQQVQNLLLRTAPSSPALLHLLAPALVTVTDVQVEINLIPLLVAQTTSPVSIHPPVLVSPVTEAPAEQQVRTQLLRTARSLTTAQLPAPE